MKDFAPEDTRVLRMGCFELLVSAALLLVVWTVSSAEGQTRRRYQKEPGSFQIEKV